MAMDQAHRRYLGRMVPISILYVAAVFGASRLLPDDAGATPLTIAVALVPAIAVFGFIWAIGRFLTDLTDEYIRMLEVRKALVATGLTLALASGWGILELFTDVPKIPIFYVFPLWCGGLAVGAVVNKLWTGDSGACA